MLKTKGIHHISSIVGHAQSNVDFYTGILGLRLVKKTLNYDDKDHYHLYYGNKDASNGIVTTFPMNNSIAGKIGDSQVGYVTYAIPKGSLEFWKERLDDFKIKSFEYSRFNFRRLHFQDPDGLEIQFIESDFKNNNAWVFNGISNNEAFNGIVSAALFSKSPKSTLKVLTEILGYEIVNQDDEYYQLKAFNSTNQFVELSKNTQGHGQVAVGTVHHIAYEVNNDEISAWREFLLEKGYNPTEIKNRSYFKSIYFREPGGILFELATKGPGLLIDETIDNLGEQFIVPKHFQKYEQEIIDKMRPLKVRAFEKF